MRSAACLLFNIKSMVPVAIKKTIAQALAYSILRYGITVFASCGIRWQNRVDNLLKNILKSVAYNSSLLTGDNIFHGVGLPSFRSLFEQTVVTRQFWNPEFKIDYVSPRLLRKGIRFVVPRCSTRYGAARRCVYVPGIFNNLPK